PTSAAPGAARPGLGSTPMPFSTADVRRRQILVLSLLIGAIVGATLLTVSLTGTRNGDAQRTRPQSTNILAPGAQVDPRDAWRGQADAQLKEIEQRSRALAQRNAELEGQGKEMLERLRKLEAGTLTPIPPAPIPAPAARPNFGPDRPGTEVSDVGAQRFPPPPPLRQGAGLPPPPISQSTPVATGIISIVLGDAVSTKNAKPTTGAEAAPAARRDARRYLPSGAFTRAVLLGGLDAPTGGQAQRNPQPVLLRLADHAILPNRYRASVKECFVVGAGYGDVSSERAYIRTESLSCVTRDGTAIDVPVKGYVAGEDGKAGMRGRLVSKQGQILANALLAGVASGIGHAFQQGATTLSVSPLGTTGTVDGGRQLEAGLGTGIGKALDRLAQYYISLAEKVFPVIEVDAGRSVDVVLTQGVALPEMLGADADFDHLAQLTERRRALRRTNDDDDKGDED
ncbi:MAG: TraB/VirB10 family protein, partial [Burkholderiales bacterium]|nr:TraB/VirB10 family protein [Burkholderiales bacterium]